MLVKMNQQYFVVHNKNRNLLRASDKLRSVCCVVSKQLHKFGAHIEVGAIFQTVNNTENAFRIKWNRMKQALTVIQL